MKKETSPLWTPSPDESKKTNLFNFMKRVNQTYQTKFSAFSDLHAWSIKNPRDFWRALWTLCDVLSSKTGKQEILSPNGIFKTQFFPDAELNYAENLLRPRPSDTPSIIFWGEDKVKRTLLFKELYEEVAKLAAYLKSIGVKKGDRVAGYTPNMPEAVTAMLATTSMGAIWSSCSPDFGVSGVLDRFGQIEPKVLFMADHYIYNGKKFDCFERAEALEKGLPSLEKIIVFPYEQKALPHSSLSQSTLWGDALKPFAHVKDIEFTQVPFNHPLFILYSSGTTGAPKCIVHGTGGTLLQHLKEHQLHCDIRPDDRVFYFTTCGWMMWNWQVSALASKAALLLYDGSPFSPSGEILWEYAEKGRATLFGTSAKYIDALEKAEIHPKDTYDLSALRMLTSTGSPLAPERFEFAYKNIKPDMCLASISGGTDIISCFALGNPMGSVWAGELQAPGLGMDVHVFNEHGQPVKEEKGELVCCNAFPSMPVFFWGDKDEKKYHAAYFEKFPNVWCHGDYVEYTSHGGFIIYGRSDTILNPGGVRIGTAEIYREVEQIPEVLESLVVGQEWKDDVRVVLFVKLKEGISLTENLIKKIKNRVRTHASPRHVPAKVIQVPDIPRTKSGKIVELAVRDIIHGRPVKNLSALSNPEALEYYQELGELNY